MLKDLYTTKCLCNIEFNTWNSPFCHKLKNIFPFWFFKLFEFEFIYFAFILSTYSISFIIDKSKMLKDLHNTKCLCNIGFKTWNSPFCYKLKNIFNFWFFQRFEFEFIYFAFIPSTYFISCTRGVSICRSLPIRNVLWVDFLSSLASNIFFWLCL